MKYLLFYKNLFAKNVWLSYALIFLCAFFLSAFLQSSPTILDPDGFYHIKMAELMRTSGIVYDFRALPHTLLAEHYADHHLLYHAFLIPFITTLPPILGAKLGTALMAGIIALACYAFLKHYRTPYSEAFVVLLSTCHPFLLRMNLIKASGIAILFLMAGLYALFHKKFLLLFVLSFLYVWTHAGWPLMLVFLSAWIVGIMAQNFITKKPFDANDILRASAAVLGGLALGLIINPYFPHNIFFYKEQILHIAVGDVSQLISVGSEWYPYALPNVLATAPLPLLLFLLGLGGIALLSTKRQALHSQTPLTECFTLGLLSLFFFALLFKSKRHIEYFVPTAFLFFGITCVALVKEKIFSARDVASLLPKRLNQRFLRITLIITGFLLFITLFVRDVVSTKALFEMGYAHNAFAKTGEWLRGHTRPGDIVFHSRWEEFPPLFYETGDLGYIIGLDPAFLYDYKKELYWKWLRISEGTEPKAYEIIRYDFQAQWVFANPNNHAFQELLKKDSRFRKTFESAEGTLYAL